MIGFDRGDENRHIKLAAPQENRSRGPAKNPGWSLGVHQGFFLIRQQARRQALLDLGWYAFLFTSRPLAIWAMNPDPVPRPAWSLPQFIELYETEQNVKLALETGAAGLIGFRAPRCEGGQGVRAHHWQAPTSAISGRAVVIKPPHGRYHLGGNKVTSGPPGPFGLSTSSAKAKTGNPSLALEGRHLGV